jgi:hypothetical protein
MNLWTQWRIHAAILFAIFCAIPPAIHVAWSQPASRNLPARLDRYLSAVVRPTQAERNSLLAGRPLAKLLDGDSNSEVAVFAGIWIDAPIHRYVELLQGIENFERGKGFRATKRISAVPKIEDFAAMRLPPEDVEALRTCRAGDCDVKLSASAMRRFQTEVNWRAANRQDVANNIFRQMALEYVTGYLQGGNERLAVYGDGSQPTLVANEFRLMADRMPELSTFMPNIRRYLLEFPRVRPPDVTSFLYWQDVQFGLKPTLRINHLSIHEGPEDTAVASKMLYASHYFRTALELRILVPDPARGRGFWFFTASRSRSDGLDGFLGRLVRSRVRNGARDGALAALVATKNRLER